MENQTSILKNMEVIQDMNNAIKPFIAFLSEQGTLEEPETKKWLKQIKDEFYKLSDLGLVPIQLTGYAFPEKGKFLYQLTCRDAQWDYQETPRIKVIRKNHRMDKLVHFLHAVLHKGNGTITLEDVHFCDPFENICQVSYISKD